MHNMNSNICYNFYYIRLYSIAFLIFFVAVLSGCDQRKKANIFQGYVEGEYVYVASPFAGRLEKLMTCIAVWAVMIPAYQKQRVKIKISFLFID